MKKNTKFIIAVAIFITIILLALFVGDVGDNIRALGRILSMEGILLSDALGINRDYGGALNGLVLNTFITVGTALMIIKLAKVPLEGAVIAGIFTIAGFTFVGKNLWNVLPIYLGVFLYSKFRKTHLRESIIPLLFATAIAPLVSYLVFGAGMSHVNLPIRIALAISSGTLAGFLAPIVAVQAMKFHGGYNLYNIGFTMGLLAVLAHGMLRVFGINVQFSSVPVAEYPDYTIVIMSVLAIFSIVFIVLAFVKDKDVIKKYKLILNQTGQAPSNFSESAGQSAVMLNIGIMGLIALALIIPLLLLVDIPFLGVFGASTLTIMGFAAFGKHPLNTLPIIAGTMIAFFIIKTIDSPFLLIHPTDNPEGAYYSAFNIHVYVSAVFFATCLAPISKEYGWKAGIITGLIHMTMVMTARSFQGGFNLYNNGWVAGFVGGILVPIFETFKAKPEEAK